MLHTIEKILVPILSHYPTKIGHITMNVKVLGLHVIRFLNRNRVVKSRYLTCSEPSQ